MGPEPAVCRAGALGGPEAPGIAVTGPAPLASVSADGHAGGLSHVSEQQLYNSPALEI